MENLPKKIYLNIGTNQSEDFKELSEVTWSQDRIGKDCVEYVLGAEHQARQQPARKTLDECKDEVAMEKGFSNWKDLLRHQMNFGLISRDSDEANKRFYAQTKAVEPQEGWVDVTPETMPKDYGNFLVSDKDGAIDLNHFDGEHFYDHWGNRNYPAFYMPLPEPPSHPNQQLTSNRDDYLW